MKVNFVLKNKKGTKILQICMSMETKQSIGEYRKPSAKIMY